LTGFLRRTPFVIESVFDPPRSFGVVGMTEAFVAVDDIDVIDGDRNITALQGVYTWSIARYAQ
jgi:hypothetical protein